MEGVSGLAMSKMVRWYSGLGRAAAARMGFRPWPSRDEPRLPPEIARQFGDLMLQFERDPTVVFETPGQAHGHVYGAVKDFAKSWAREHTCFVCGRTSILRSHTLQMSGPLAVIAENGEVVRPIGGVDGTYSMKPVRIRAASTFPGFCKTHERLFSGFETRKTIETGSDIALQAFRMVCREMFRLQHEAAFLERQLADYRKRKFDYVVGNLRGEVRRGAKVMINHDAREIETEKQISAKKRDHARLLEGLYADFLNAIVHGTPVSSVLRSANVLEIYPVCLSGFNWLRFKDDGPEIDTPVLFGVIPSDAGTLVIAATEKQGAKALNHYFDHVLVGQGRWGVLDQIEAWILYHTDHWFIRPSTWNAIPAERRETICDLMQEELSIGMTSPISIFDDIRQRLIDIAEGLTEYPGDLALQAKVACERARLQGPLQRQIS